MFRVLLILSFFVVGCTKQEKITIEIKKDGKVITSGNTENLNKSLERSKSIAAFAKVKARLKNGYKELKESNFKGKNSEALIAITQKNEALTLSDIDGLSYEVLNPDKNYLGDKVHFIKVKYSDFDRIFYQDGSYDE